MKYQIHIQDSGEIYPCSESVSLLTGMESLGRKGIPVGCRNGGCGVCKVQVVQGQIHKRVMSRAHVSEQEEVDGFVLACRACPRSDVSMRVVGTMKQRICGD